MLDEILNKPGLTRYLTRFKPEQIFLLFQQKTTQFYSGLVLLDELKQNEESIDWLIFQMDLDQVKKSLDLDLADLTKLQIKKP